MFAQISAQRILLQSSMFNMRTVTQALPLRLRVTAPKSERRVDDSTKVVWRQCSTL